MIAALISASDRLREFEMEFHGKFFTSYGCEYVHARSYSGVKYVEMLRSIVCFLPGLSPFNKKKVTVAVTCVCLLKCLEAQFSMSVSEEGFLRVNSGKIPQLALGIMFRAFRLAVN